MPRPIINEDLCKGCGYCTLVCPKHILKIDKERLNALGYHPVKVTNPEECIGCRYCEVVCPEFAIYIEK